jgi:hypothetical protein
VILELHPSLRMSVWYDPAAKGKIEYSIVDKAQPHVRYLQLTHEYECAPSGHLRVEIRAAPRGDQDIDFNPVYDGRGCRVPHPDCCIHAPRALGDE